MIPARGGSVGIPRKNLQVVGGITLLERAIRTCLLTRLVRRVYVSTDDQEIATEALRCGARVIQRPAELATGEAATSDVLLHALDQMHHVPRVLALVQCTAPLLTADEVDGCIGRLITSQADTAVAAAEFHGMVCRQGYMARVEGVNWDPRRRIDRRQDMLPQWRIAGSVWAIDVPAFLRRREIYSTNCVLYKVDRVMDIDDQQDLALSHLLCSQREVYYPH